MMIRYQCTLLNRLSRFFKRSSSIHDANCASWEPEHRLDLNYLKERILWGLEYHLDEYAQRLKEIGGLGTGGTELQYTPFQGICRVVTNQEKKQHALRLSMIKVWDEASWSYVQGHFRACILLSAATVERALKHELETREIASKGMTLGRCISACRQCKIIPDDGNDEIVRAALSVKNARDDVIHANVELERPHESLTCPLLEHEVVPLTDMPEHVRECVVSKGSKRAFLSSEQEATANIVYEYKASAKSTRQNALSILKYLYGNVQPVGHIETYQILEQKNRQ